MAIEKTIILNAETKGAVKGVNDLEKSLNKTDKSQKKLKDTTQETTKSQEASKKASLRNAAGFEAVNKATGGAIRGVRGLIKQMWLLVSNPIGAVVGALVLGLTALFKAFASTKSGGEKLAQMMAGVSATIDVLRDRVLKVGEALVKFFTGDFKGALEVGKQAVSGFGEEVAREFKQAAESTRNLQEVADAARGLSVSRAELNKNLIEAKEIIEGSTASYNEKKKAIELVRIAETKQTQDELKNAQKKLDAIILANSLSDSGREDLEKEAQARIEVINLEAESSRNKTKFNKLEKLAHTEEMARLKAISDEKKAADDLEAARIKKSEDEKKKALEKAEADETKRLDSIQKIQDDFKIKQQDKDAESELEKINLEEGRKIAELERLGATEEQKLEIENYYSGLRLDNKKATDEAEAELDKQKIADKKAVVDAISQFADAESGIGKALLLIKQGLALQETIMDLKRITFKGVEAIGSAGVSTAQNVAESSKIGFPQNIITIGSAIAQGVGIISSVKKAVSKTKAKAGASASASVPSISTPSIPTSLPPSFNVVGATETSILSDAVAGQTNQPVQAYVVANDVTTAQSLENNIVEGATI